MVEENKEQGLFRLKDLDSLEVESEELFPRQKDTTQSGEWMEAVGADAMVEAIRKARTIHEGAETDESAATAFDEESSPEIEVPPIGAEAETEAEAAGEAEAEPTTKDTAPQLPKSESLGVRADGVAYHSDEHKAVVEAIQARDRRGRRTRVAVLFLVFTVLIGGLAAAYVVIANAPQTVIAQPLPVRQAALSHNGSALERLDLAFIPIPEEPEIDPEAERAAERERARRERRERERRRQEQLDREDLF